MPQDVQTLAARSERLARFDLSPVTRRLIAEGYANADKLEREFRRLALLWLSDQGMVFVPSEQVDSYWHALVLDTRRYQRFCREVFGRFIHHVPDDGDVLSRSRGYAATLDSYRRHFGPAPSAFWPAPRNQAAAIAAAGRCGGGGHCGSR